MKISEETKTKTKYVLQLSPLEAEIVFSALGWVVDQTEGQHLIKMLEKMEDAGIDEDTSIKTYSSAGVTLSDNE